MDIELEIRELRKRLSNSSSSLHKIIRTMRLQNGLKQTLSGIEENINKTISKLEEIEKSAK